ncbi:MAG: outer membrane lipoprotein carrier protein LolA [Planctomycetota bacterium]
MIWAAACLALGLLPLAGHAAADETSAVASESEGWQELVRVLEASPMPASVQARFTQERISLLLDEPVRSEGRFVAKGKTARLSLVTPERVEMRFDDAAMLIYFPGDRVLEHYRIPREGLAYATGRPDPDRLAQDFTLVDLSEDETSNLWTLTLEPRDALGDHLLSLTMRFDPALGLIVGTSIVDAAGDRTDIALTNIQTDVDVSDADLELSVPEDVVHVYPEGSPSAAEGP